MSDEKPTPGPIERIRVDGPYEHQDSTGPYCRSADVAVLEARNAELLAALDDLVEECRGVDVGEVDDAGYDLEGCLDAARTILAKARGGDA